MTSPRHVVALTVATALVVVAADQLVKAIVRAEIADGRSREVVGSTLRLVHAENDGVAFGRLSGSTWLVALIVAVALIALLVYFVRHLDTPYVWLPTGLLLGGAAGNIVDRVSRGTVTDFVKLPHWPAFNLADIAITVGVVSLVIVVEADVRRRERAEAEAEAGRARDGAAGPA